jgi:hypothetical protein
MLCSVMASKVGFRRDRFEVAALDDQALREHVERLAKERHGTLQLEERGGWFAASIFSPDHPPDVDIGSSEWIGLAFSWREAMELLAVLRAFTASRAVKRNRQRSLSDRRLDASFSLR